MERAAHTTAKRSYNERKTSVNSTEVSDLDNKIVELFKIVRERG